MCKDNFMETLSYKDIKCDFYFCSLNKREQDDHTVSNRQKNKFYKDLLCDI